MRMAMLGIGMAVGAGTDIAMDAADVVLMQSSLTDAVTAMCTMYPDLPRRMKRDGKKVIQRTQKMMHL